MLGPRTGAKSRPTTTRGKTGGLDSRPGVRTPKFLGLPLVLYGFTGILAEIVGDFSALALYYLEES